MVMKTITWIYTRLCFWIADFGLHVCQIIVLPRFVKCQFELCYWNSTWLRTGVPGFDSQQVKTFPPVSSPRPHPFQLVPRFFPPGSGAWRWPLTSLSDSSVVCSGTALYLSIFFKKKILFDLHWQSQISSLVGSAWEPAANITERFFSFDSEVIAGDATEEEMKRGQSNGW